MKAVTIMYDSLNRKYLPCYGCNDIIAPNFQRLARKCQVYDNFYAGSLPCMPARRELHTGRYNFLHRSWSPLEPFDISMPEILSNNGICTQFISDHCHYWQDGGLTYHQRYSAFEMIRGQEGDEWHARAEGYTNKRNPKRQDKINREYTRNANTSHSRCYFAAEDFLKHNHDKDNWYLHLEYFDPHEPFDVPQKYRDLYGAKEEYDWPIYKQSLDKEYIQQAILNYKAAISMCDAYLGKILDLFDKYDLWKDTLLIVNTDHGFMLGEHGFTAKNYMPCYQEIVNLPFFLHNPKKPHKDGTRNRRLSQTIDIAPTLLDYFSISIPEQMKGLSLLGNKNHQYILFGYFGKHINITDGHYVYMRSARDNKQLYEYTLMPSRLASRFTQRELEMVEGFYKSKYTNNIPVLKIPAHTPDVPNQSHHQYDDHIQYGDLLFNLDEDPKQESNLAQTCLETCSFYKDRMKEELEKHLAPEEQFVRLKLKDC